ncbi:MAG: ABC transporter ATP-binding protein [Rhodobacterales bacterium]|nr:ABC transporter ATP-binding protein [Rhodobacterales bacterium]
MSLDIQGISKSFGSQAPILREISLTVDNGEFLALLGPSGSGKTTLLSVISGLVQPDEGRLFLDGEDITDLPAGRRRFGTVFQSYALFRHMTVAENVGFGLRIAPHGTRPSRGERAARVAQLLEAVGLADLGDRYPAQLSGGQQQRVAMARALAIKPRLLLLDEPFSALDAQVRLSLRAMVRDLPRKLGVTAILVTHDQAEAFAIADRVAVMNAGRIEQIGSPETLAASPHTGFVREFLEAGR